MKLTNKKSPIYYYGNKFYLHDILAKVVSELSIKKTVEVFGGSAFFTMNINSDIKILNDSNIWLFKMYKYIKETPYDDIKFDIEKIINEYSLSEVNKDAYVKFRSDFNKNKNPLSLIILMSFSFNHLIRFNKSGDFNVPFGLNRSGLKSSFWKKIQDFKTGMNDTNIFNSDFRDIKIERDTLYFLDPPYINSVANYNESNRFDGGWDVHDEDDLVDMINIINDKGSKFVLTYTSDSGLVSKLKKYHIINSKPRKMIKKRNEVIITNF